MQVPAISSSQAYVPGVSDDTGVGVLVAVGTGSLGLATGVLRPSQNPPTAAASAAVTVTAAKTTVRGVGLLQPKI